MKKNPISRLIVEFRKVRFQYIIGKLQEEERGGGETRLNKYIRNLVISDGTSFGGFNQMPTGMEI